MNTIILIRHAQAVDKRFGTCDMDRPLNAAGLGHSLTETIETAQAKPAGDQSKKTGPKTNTARSDQAESRSLMNGQEDNPADLKQASQKP